jgi:hypothetical protein
MIEVTEPPNAQISVQGHRYMNKQGNMMLPKEHNSSLVEDPKENEECLII